MADIPSAENLKQGAPGESSWGKLTDAIGKAIHGPDYDPVEALRIKQEAQIEIWLRETRAGSWLVWPVWAIGWVAGYVVFIIRGLWANVVRGYKRVNTTPWTED